MEIGNINIDKYINLLFDSAINYIPRIIGALLVLWIGFKVIGFIARAIEKILEKQKINPMLKGFIISLSNILLKILVIISAAGLLGVQTSSFVAMLAAAGFAIGMALSGTLQNFAGGIMILVLKPFKIGDYVSIGGFEGTITDIQIFNTIILTLDKKRIILPNSDISNGSITNFSSEPKRRIDLVIGVIYSDDIDKVKKILENISKDDERILIDEGVTIGVLELAANSVNFAFRFYVQNSDYLSTKFDTLEKIKKTFDKKGISFPFPQREVHIVK